MSQDTSAGTGESDVISDQRCQPESFIAIPAGRRYLFLPDDCSPTLINALVRKVAALPSHPAVESLVDVVS